MHNWFLGGNMSVAKLICVILPIILSLVLLSSCDTGGGSSTVGMTFVVAWSLYENLGGEIGTDTYIFFSRSTDGGVPGKLTNRRLRFV